MLAFIAALRQALLACTLREVGPGGRGVGGTWKLGANALQFSLYSRPQMKICGGTLSDHHLVTCSVDITDTCLPACSPSVPCCALGDTGEVEE